MLLSSDVTIDHWLAILRIVIGLWWIKSVLHKNLASFVRSGMMNWTNSLLDNHPWPPFAAMIRRLINANPTVFPYLVVAGEAAVGIGLTLGFLTPIAAAVGFFLNLNYLLTAGVKPKDTSVNECFQCEQGQNITMMAAELVIFAAGAWAVWSIDNALNITWGSLL